MLIGLTGKREVGKSEIAAILVREHGFRSLHAASPMKSAAIGYLTHFGVPNATAKMVNGAYRDVPYTNIKVPNPYLTDGPDWTVADLGVPGKDCRELMEKLGYQMGKEMGPEWTLGAELVKQRLIHGANTKFVVESVVYESDVFTADDNGFILKVVRPNHEGVAGVRTDAAVDKIKADLTFVNDKQGLDALSKGIKELLPYIESLML